MPNDFGDPVQYDERIVKGAVLSDERGTLYVACGRYLRADKTPNGWHGIGFNGKRVSADLPEFIAPNLNVFMKEHQYA